jgi:hypothetical protein
MPHFKQSFILITLVLTVIGACTAKNETSSIPADFVFTMDALSQQRNTMRNLHVNIKINAQGAGRFEYYDNGGTISYSPDDILTYEQNQVVKAGKFHLTHSELEQLWDTLNKNHFFELDEHYEAQLGLSYAFIMVESKGKKHLVNNIGVEVPEIRAIVEGVDEILPEAISLEYREGFAP